MSFEILRKDIKEALTGAIRSPNEVAEILHPQYSLQNKKDFRKKVMQQITYMTGIDEICFSSMKQCPYSRKTVKVKFYTIGYDQIKVADDRRIKRTPYVSVSKVQSTWLTPLGF